MNFREWTLPVYTILTQLSVGSLLLIWIIRMRSHAQFGAERVEQSIKIPVSILLVTMTVAIGFAHFHLSKPYLSFLALRNLGSSWLSRELLANLVYIILVGALVYLLWKMDGNYKIKSWLGWLAILAGFATDYCMARIYLIPSQPAWNSSLTPGSFLVTTLLLGALTVPVLLAMDMIFRNSEGQAGQAVHGPLIRSSLGPLAFGAVLLSVLMGIITFFQVAALFSGSQAARISLDLLLNIYQPLLIIRLILLFTGAGWISVAAIFIQQKKLTLEGLLLQSFIACLLVLVSEILGRFLFYAIHVRIGI